jgi:hypothetical protein
MKRLLLAGLLVLPLALSRTGARAEQDDAYGSLVGMAGSASSDKGPQAGEIPSDNPSNEERRADERPSVEDPKTEYGSARAVKAEKKAPAPAAKREAAKDDDRTAVAVPAAAAPRVWTRLFASLLPPAARPASFEIAVSTAARPARPEPAHQATAASAAGRERGMLELVALATAP